MAFALVGSPGVVSVGASGASVTPAFGQTTTAGNLLICAAIGLGVNTIPATPGGWTNELSQAAGTSCGARLVVKIAAGSDSAPTITGIASDVLIVQLWEFSGELGVVGNVLNTGGTASGTTSPVVATAGNFDSATGNQLVFYMAGALYSVAPATASLVTTLNNGATATSDTNNGSTSTTTYYDFGYGITTGNTNKNTASFAFPTLNITNTVVIEGSFKLGSLPASVTTDSVVTSDVLTAVVPGYVPAISLFVND